MARTRSIIHLWFLIRDFYAPRMRELINARIKGDGFDCEAWEAAWINTPGNSQLDPFDQPAEAARDLVSHAITKP